MEFSKDSRVVIISADSETETEKENIVWITTTFEKVDKMIVVAKRMRPDFILVDWKSFRN